MGGYEKEHIREIRRLENEIKKRDKKIDKLEVENECLKRDCHIYLEALILSKHKIFGKSSEHTKIEGQQSFFNEAETEYAEKVEEPVKKTVKGYTRRNPKTKRDEIIKNIETDLSSGKRLGKARIRTFKNNNGKLGDTLQ